MELTHTIVPDIVNELPEFNLQVKFVFFFVFLFSDDPLFD